MFGIQSNNIKAAKTQPVIGRIINQLKLIRILESKERNFKQLSRDMEDTNKIPN